MKKITGVVIVAGDGIAHQGEVIVKKSKTIPRGGVVANLVRQGKKHIHTGFLYVKKHTFLFIKVRQKKLG
ncbi:MAG: hypothetical protein WCJ81_07905 [bacterium]